MAFGTWGWPDHVIQYTICRSSTADHPSSLTYKIILCGTRSAESPLDWTRLVRHTSSCSTPSYASFTLEKKDIPVLSLRGSTHVLATDDDRAPTQQTIKTTGSLTDDWSLSHSHRHFASHPYNLISDRVVSFALRHIRGHVHCQADVSYRTSTSVP